MLESKSMHNSLYDVAYSAKDPHGEIQTKAVGAGGLCQLGRVARGPRPRRTVPAQQGYATVRQVARIEPTKLLPRGSNSQVVDSTFVLLTLAAPAPLLFAEDVELLSDTVRLLSDTV